MQILYSLIVRSYFSLIRLFSFWNPKAKAWVLGRKHWSAKLQNAFKDDDKVIWFHCASLGEFEQGRPIIEKVRQERPENKILITFFSSSGFEKRKHYEAADLVVYLPRDTKRNARLFLSIVPVELAFFIKYEFWFHFLNALNKKNIPVYLASGNFRKEQLFFKWYGAWYRNLLAFFAHIFVQNESSAKLLKAYNLTHVSVSGDTRFDRIQDISNSAKEVGGIRDFVRGRKVLIGGSTWEMDEKILRSIADRFENDVCLLIAPHEPVSKNIERLQSLFPGAVLLTELEEHSNKKSNALIINTIGQLSSLYRYGDLALIGGGFGRGIHNILEAAGAGLPVMFGPNYKAFIEAVRLHELGGAFVIHDQNDALQIVARLFGNNSDLKKCSDIAMNFTKNGVGATKVIFRHVFAPEQGT